MLAFIAWLLVTLLPAPQIVASLNEQRSQASSARTAVQLSGDIAASRAVSAFRANSSLSSVNVVAQGLSREYEILLPGISDDLADAQLPMARVEQSLAPSLQELATVMGRAPSPADGTDERTSAAIASVPGDWIRSLALQHAQVDQANTSGQKANMLGLAVLLAALAFSTAILAMVRSGGSSRLFRIMAVSLLAGAVLSVLSTV
ncbi:MAG TPA: hypothetical protein VFG33_00965 [Kribbella sp.]|uniref:hypothetical protein n=1 Tax=Kribbella sp. TaxID=1871183 RepID=UPI002D771346|nr:hypothetical protein [Kribbella sp.]HET6291901.1 hypothetical protein [Kribbella sp.]